MTEVDFYVLAADSRQNRYQLACRLSAEARESGRRVVIHTTSEEDARHMDRLLWTYQDQSFLPHGRIGRCSAEDNPILIGNGELAEAEHQLLINLDPEVPTFFSRFERLAECIDGDSAVRVAGRERYRFYRDRGYRLNTHELA